MDVRKLHQSLENIHRPAAKLSTKLITADVESQNRKTGVQRINLDPGYFVLRGKIALQRGNNLSLKLNVPNQVVKCHDNYLFDIKHLLTSKEETSHGRRLKFFRNKDPNITE